MAPEPQEAKASNVAELFGRTPLLRLDRIC